MGEGRPSDSAMNTEDMKQIQIQLQKHPTQASVRLISLLEKEINGQSTLAEIQDKLAKQWFQDYMRGSTEWSIQRCEEEAVRLLQAQGINVGVKASVSGGRLSLEFV